MCAFSLTVVCVLSEFLLAIFRGYSLDYLLAAVSCIPVSNRDNKPYLEVRALWVSSDFQMLFAKFSCGGFYLPTANL